MDKEQMDKEQWERGFRAGKEEGIASAKIESSQIREMVDVDTILWACKHILRVITDSLETDHLYYSEDTPLALSRAIPMLVNCAYDRKKRRDEEIQDIIECSKLNCPVDE